MQARLDLNANPAAYRAMLQLEQYVQGSGINPTLLELIKIRASQINGCAFCIDMHTKDARLHGETEQRIYALNGWRETPFFTPEERAALALTEAVTLIATNPVSDALYKEVSQHFSPEQIANLLMAIVTINGWNRIAIAARTVPGTYEPPTPDQLKALAV
ncbi:carboxymuconolactone decarboxylase family protein [Leptolyngbya sp. NIES-2104]|uniref:carboxymuconolactone decarboxylase family protein n=1 Tax=Leptolyngbya sp. NIES-2104 TaxID=1552121 RepID=UPI0006EC5FFD|nr:carboxymuconolactone decarboxylase family protein [Leptolyngbya sp. NIES-2104]GAP96630.1 4-carboxymuconolactone decarboxylase domain/alkylhydroperoxidase AhpD family core domain protein [Leptolyngbya sp. NIES-2104]